MNWRKVKEKHKKLKQNTREKINTFIKIKNIDINYCNN
jgi:hypothetical protein